MSKAALSRQLHTTINVIRKHIHQDLKRGDQGYKSGVRYSMDKNVSFLEISPEDLRKGTKIIRNDATNTSDSSYRITNRQASLLAQATVNFYNKKYGGRFNKTDMVRAHIKARNNLRTWVQVGVFKVRVVPIGGAKQKDSLVEIGVAKPFFLGEDAEHGILVGNNFGLLRTNTSSFARSLGSFMKNASKGERFQGVFTVSELLGKGKSTVEDITKVLGTGPGNRSNIHVGHRTVLGDPFKQTVAEVSVENTLDRLSGYSNMLKSMIEPQDILDIVNRLKDKSRVEQNKIFVNFDAQVTKNTRNLKNLKLLFTGAISYIFMSADLNANSEEAKSIATFEEIAKKKIYSKETIEAAVNELRAEGKLLTMKSSPSWITGVLKTVNDLFMKGVKKAQRKSFKVSVPKTEPGKNTKTKASVKMPINNIKIAATKLVSSGKTDVSKASGYTPSLEITIPENYKEESCTVSTRKLLAIQGRLNYELQDALKANMKLPALVYRTGRFAKSVKVSAIRQNPDCSLTAFYSYMTDPYSVFDPSISSYHGLSSPTRNPQKIIGDSIRSIAQQVMKDKYTIHPQWI